MPSIGEFVRTYRELAEIYEARGEAQMRDRFLVLAADAALTAGKPEEAERLRGSLLRHNPHHLLKPYASLAEAMKSADIRNYIAALRRSHPFERAEHLLTTLSGDADEAALQAKGAQQAQPEPQVFKIRQEEPVSARFKTESAGLPRGPAPVAAHQANPPEIFAIRPEPVHPGWHCSRDM